MFNRLTGFFKFVIGWAVVFLLRLIPYRAPNIEPVMATLMPFSKRYGVLGAFVFGFLSITLFDLFVGKAGQWTIITAVTYGVVGVASWFFFRKKESNRKNYLTFAILGTIFYDAVTGLSTGPLLFGQSFAEAFWGQIPFTLWHLLGNICFALILSPALYEWIVTNPKLETKAVLKTFKLGTK